MPLNYQYFERLLNSLSVLVFSTALFDAFILSVSMLSCFLVLVSVVIYCSQNSNNATIKKHFRLLQLNYILCALWHYGVNKRNKSKVNNLFLIRSCIFDFLRLNSKSWRGHNWINTTVLFCFGCSIAVFHASHFLIRTKYKMKLTFGTDTTFRITAVTLVHFIVSWFTRFPNSSFLTFNKISEKGINYSAHSIYIDYEESINEVNS